MCSSVSLAIIARFELTKRICSHAKIPEQALQAIFSGAMNQLEVEANVEFENSIKERIWEVISEKRLQELKKTLLSEVYLQIQEEMNEDQVAELLNPQKNRVYIANINNMNTICVSAAKDAVLKKAKSMADELIYDLIAELKNEGIHIPKYK